MTDPNYRRCLQRLADFLVATLPDAWHEGVVRAAFPSDIATDLDLWYFPSPGAKQAAVDFPSSMTRDFVYAARAVRDELHRAGNPKCKAFVFRLTKGGKSSLGVEY